MKSRSSLLAPAHPGGPGKRAIKWLWCKMVVVPICILKIFSIVQCRNVSYHKAVEGYSHEAGENPCEFLWYSEYHTEFVHYGDHGYCAAIPDLQPQ